MTDVIAGRFALCDPIARGGSGVVWRAYDRRIGKFCAAKVLRRRDAGDLLRFVREQSVRLSHPNVLTPYSWAAEDTHVVIASDLIDGGSVSTLIGDYGALAEGTVALILDQLLAALEAVHAAGLVHRDVKPANLLLRATGTGRMHVLLGDFGLAITEQDARLTQVGMVVGTPGYVAPELLTGTSPVHADQDLYSAGRVAAALLCGAEPATGAGRPDLSGMRDPQLRALVETLTATNPARRPASATQARAWLRSRVPADPRPRTRTGEPVDVMRQLPPPPPISELVDSGIATAATAPLRQGSVPPGQSGPSGTSGPSAPDAPPRRPRRRAALIAAAVAVLAGAGIPLGIVLAAAHPSGHAPPGNNPPVRVVAANSACSWDTQNDAAITSTGQHLTCELTGNRYVWTPG